MKRKHLVTKGQVHLQNRKNTAATRIGADKDIDVDGSFLYLCEQTVSNIPSSTIGCDTELSDKSVIPNFLPY